MILVCIFIHRINLVVRLVGCEVSKLQVLHRAKKKVASKAVKDIPNMGKSKKKRFRQPKQQPTGLPSVKEVISNEEDDIECSGGNNQSIGLLEKVKYCTWPSLGLT